MKTLLILNDPSYGTERSYNGLRLAAPPQLGLVLDCADPEGNEFCICHGSQTRTAR